MRVNPIIPANAGIQRPPAQRPDQDSQPAPIRDSWSGYLRVNHVPKREPWSPWFGVFRRPRPASRDQETKIPSKTKFRAGPIDHIYGPPTCFGKAVVELSGPSTSPAPTAMAESTSGTHTQRIGLAPDDTPSRDDSVPGVTRVQRSFNVGQLTYECRR